MSSAPKNNISIIDSIESYIKYKTSIGKISPVNASNRKIELLRFKSFCDALKITNPEKIHKSHLKKYLNNLNIASSTKITLINIYRSYFDYLVENEIILDNIAALIERPKTNMAVFDFLTIEELEQMYRLEAENASQKVVDRNLLILSLLVETGLRVSEMINIKMINVRLDSKQIWTKQKGGGEIFVPVPDSIIEQFETWYSMRTHYKNAQTLDWLFLATSGKQLNRKQVYEIVSNAIARAGFIKRKSGPHLLRHTGATLRAMRGDDIERIRIWLRHKTYLMSQRYVHAAQVLQQQSVENEVLKNKAKFRKPLPRK
ncbi:MAG: tyrosine-type recombinase/integrase [Desulfobacteraceae bacterium]|nr:tyrosine-type recombinase/integrase [Desulfobacteraceae bacterium]